MKKRKLIIILILIFIGIVLSIPLSGFLFVAYYPMEPETKGKIIEAMRIIDLKNLPSGHFQKVIIVTDDFAGNEKIVFEVPDDKMLEFETGFRKCVQDAVPLTGMLACITPTLKIQTESGKYIADICYEDDDVTIQRSSLFYRGFVSQELRKVFHDAGLKYTTDMDSLKSTEVNQP